MIKIPELDVSISSSAYRVLVDILASTFYRKGEYRCNYRDVVMVRNLQPFMRATEELAQKGIVAMPELPYLVVNPLIIPGSSMVSRETWNERYE
jgi:hypothetical protein